VRDAWPERFGETVDEEARASREGAV